MRNLVTTILLIAMGPTFASGTGFYVQSAAGIAGIPNTTTNDGVTKFSYDTGFAAALELGFLAQLSEHATVRFGQEGLYITNDLDNKPLAQVNATTSGQLSMLGGMFNAYIDIFSNQVVSFYLGSGVGLAIIEVTSSSHVNSRDDSSLMTQVKAGLTFKPLQAIAVFAGYRHIRVNNLNDELSGLEPPRYHIGEMGLRFTFM